MAANILLHPQDIERFWSKVEIAGPDDCWQWKGSKTTAGYGNIRINHGNLYAHRVSWFIKNGPIPNDMYICHTCDAPACANPRHLFLGTPSDNTQDMMKKKRDFRGKGSSKFTENAVRVIRIYTELLPIRKLARHLGVSHTTLINMRDRKTWRHVK